MNKKNYPSSISYIQNFITKRSFVFAIHCVFSSILPRRFILLSLPILFLIMPLSCGCFPDKSPEIEKQAKEDQDIAPLEAEEQAKKKALKEALGEFKKKYEKDGSLNKATFTQADLKDLFENKYKPYLEASEKLSQHNATNHPNVWNRKNAEKQAKNARSLLNNMPTWIASNDINKMHDQIVVDIKAFKIT